MIKFPNWEFLQPKFQLFIRLQTIIDPLNVESVKEKARRGKLQLSGLPLTEAAELPTASWPISKLTAQRQFQ